MPDEIKENMPTPEQPKEGLPETPAKAEIKPIAGGAPWLYADKTELDKLTSPKLRRMIEALESTPPNLLTEEVLRQRYLKIQDWIFDDMVDPAEAQDYLIKISTRMEELSGARAEKQAKEEDLWGELIEEQRRIRRATEASARMTTPEIRARVKEEIEGDQRKAEIWLRERLSRLESLEIPFESYANTTVLNEIHSVLGEPEFAGLREEYWARHFLHDFSLLFPRGIETAKENAGLITISYLQRLTRLPGVRCGFREYERRAKREQEIYEEIERGEKGSIDPKEKLITAVGAEVTLIRNQITEKIARKAGIPDGAWAQKIAERIWHITGRSSFWDAYTKSPRERMVNDQKVTTYEPFQGRGELAGPLWLKRLYNFQAYAELLLNKGYGLLPKYLDLGLRDFWSRSAEKLGLSRDGSGWVQGLENVDISKLPFATELNEADYVRMMVHTGYADNNRRVLAEAGGFLDQPSWENYLKLVEIFENFPAEGERRKKKFSEVLEGTIEFNRQRGMVPGHRSLAEEKLGIKEWWDSEKIHVVIETAFQRGMLAREDANTLERKYKATKIQAEMRLAGKSAVVGGLKGILKILLGEHGRG